MRFSPVPEEHAEAASVPHGRPLVGKHEEEAAVRVLRSGRLAPGPMAEEGARHLAALSGCGSAVLLSSGTTALTLALRALGVGPQEEVAVPSYACEALLHAVYGASARPLPCDVDPQTLALDPEDVARRGAGRVRVVILVHPFGVPIRPEPFRSRGLLVVEDCAQALGARDRGAPVGSRGDVSIVSFAPTKVVTCGGPGGGLASPNRSIVAEARDLALHDEKEDARTRVNGLMGDLHAAVASVQMSRLAEFRDRRQFIARRYDEALTPLGLARLPSPEGAEPLVYRYLIRVDDAAALIEALNRKGIHARRPVYRPLHSLLGGAGFPNTEEAHRRLVSLPIYPALSDGEVERVIAEVSRCRP